MNTFDENELRSLLITWKVSPPGAALLERTRQLMCAELAVRARPMRAPAHPLLLAIIGLGLLLTVNLFYMLTLYSILRLALPLMFTTYLSYSLVVFSAAEVCIIVVAVMVFVFKNLHLPGVGAREQCGIPGMGNQPAR